MCVQSLEVKVRTFEAGGDNRRVEILTGVYVTKDGEIAAAPL